MEDLSGKQLGRYQVIEPLGEGGMAAVYKAYQPGMERYVALKILPQAFTRDPEFTGRFEQEAKVVAKLQHPHILPVHDYGEAESYTYIVMPMVESGTLADLVRGKPPLPLQRIRQITAQVGDALDYAHSKNVIHRDVKPSNILIDPRGNCLLTDFGIAKMVKGTKHFTQTGGIVGTPHYMSPEQGGGGELTQSSDIYSLGVVIYEMATGKVPFDAETPMAVVIKHMTDPLPPPSKVNPELAQGLEGVILKAMAKEPKDRYESAGKMVEAIKLAIPERTLLPEERQVATVPSPELAELERAESLAEPSIEPAAEPSRAPIPPKPKRTITPWILGAGVALLGLCGVGAFGAFQFFNARSNASATENAEATQRVQTEGQMTAVAADQIRTATAEARSAAATPEPTQTPRAASTAEFSAPPLLEGAAPADMVGSRWPVLMSDSFDGNENSWNPFQDFADEFGTRSFFITDGKYRWEMVPERDVNLTDNPDLLPLTDFFLSVEAQQVSGPDSANYGLVFRRMSSDIFYTFLISDAQMYSVWKKQDGDWTVLRDWQVSNAIRVGGVNQITVFAQGDRFMFFVNDVFVELLVDSELTQGIVGLSVELYDPGAAAEWEFDNFEVRTPWTAAVVDSFEIESGLWDTGSSSIRDLTENLAVVNGVYQWTIDCDNTEVGCISSTYLRGEENWTDFELTVEARRREGPIEAEYGVRFRDDGTNYLEFMISDRGTFSILLWYEQELDYYHFNTAAPMIIVGGTNRLTVRAEGMAFTFYINELRVAEVVEELLPAGSFAFSASVNGADQAGFEFDNFTVRVP